MEIATISSFDELCESYQCCYDLISDATDALMQFDGVVGVGIGPKQQNGQLRPDTPCFLVYVDKKQAMTELDADALIPKEICGVMTDVVEIGSRAIPVHNEFDENWLKLCASSFSTLYRPPVNDYRHAS